MEETTEKKPQGGKRPGSGRKPKPEAEKTVRMLFRMPPDVIKKVDVLAAAWGKNRTQTILKILRDFEESPHDSPFTPTTIGGIQR